MPNWFQGNVFGIFGFVLVMCMVCSDCAVCSLQYFLPFFPFYQRHALSLFPSLISKQCICREMGRVSMVHHSLVFFRFMVHFDCLSISPSPAVPIYQENCSGLKMIPRKDCFCYFSLFLKQEIPCKRFITSQLFAGKQVQGLL